MNRTAFIPLVLLIVASSVKADDRDIQGRVVDETGNPVAAATVSAFWSGNGKRLHKDGTPIVGPTKDKDEAQALWQHEGEMEPTSAEYAAKTDAQGLFTLKTNLSIHKLLAMDAARRHGGLGFLSKGKEEEPIEIRLGPLVRVRANLECTETGKPPYWGHVYVLTPDDLTRPLDNTRLVSCGSFEGRFEVSLPPGRYELDAYAESVKQEKIDVRVVPSPSLTLITDKPELDLGTLHLAPYLLPRARVEKAKANGTCFDYQKHFGEPPPAWHITEARGVRQDVTIGEYKGKWVLLTFWGLNCTVCLGEELPRLMKFYDDHKAQRDQFEIISICIDYDGELKTLADVDHALEPIVKNVWGGKTLPFPILFDPSFKTWEIFGIDGLGTTILIDPDGKMVEGDETTLAEKLK